MQLLLRHYILALSFLFNATAIITLTDNSKKLGL